MKKPSVKKPGRPRKPHVRVQLRLSPERVAKARKIGDQNVTKGIEIALDQHQQKK